MIVKFAIDLGGGSIKMGKSGSKLPRVIAPNYVGKLKEVTYISNAIDQCSSFSNIKYRMPFEKGYLVDCDLQTKIMDKLFQSELSITTMDYSCISLFLTKPPLLPCSLQKDMVEMALETNEFHGLSIISSGYCNMFGFGSNAKLSPFYKYSSGLIVDSGYSFTHCIPIIRHLVKSKAMKRIDVGGKFLTNLFKEKVSLRYFDVRDETYIMNHVKESVCYISLNFEKEMKKNKSMMLRYVLPDYINTRLGYVKNIFEKDKKFEQSIPLKYERLTIPEVLFTPSDVGMKQSGIPETIVQSVDAFNQDDHKQLLYESILVVGGSTLFKNFKQRLFNDLRSFVPDKYKLCVYQPKNPMTNCWVGLSMFSMQSESTKFFVSKEEYDESGYNICKERFIL